MIEKQQEPTEEQKAEVDKLMEKIFRAVPTTDEEGEPILAIALNVSGIFLMAGTLNRGMALSTEIMQKLADTDPVKRDQSRATLLLARAQVSAFDRALKAFVAENRELVDDVPGADAMFGKEEEEKSDAPDKG